MAELLPDRFGIAKSRPGDESARPSTQAAHSHHNPQVDTVLQYLPRSHR